MRVKEESERAGLKLNIKNLIHDFQPYYFMANRGGKGGSSDRLPLLGLRNHCRWWLQPWNQKTFASLQESMTNLDHVLKSRDSTLPTKVFGLPSGHIWLWQLDHKGGGALKNWCLQTMVLEKTAERCLDSKEIKPVNLKGNQPWVLVGRTDAEAETLVFWSSDANCWLIGKSLMLEKIEGRRRRGQASEDEVAGWHHRCNEYEFGQTSGDCEGQGGLACCSPWGHKESDTTGRLYTTTTF